MPVSLAGTHRKIVRIESMCVSLSTKSARQAGDRIVRIAKRHGTLVRQFRKLVSKDIGAYFGTSEKYQMNASGLVSHDVSDHDGSRRPQGVTGQNHLIVLSKHFRKLIPSHAPVGVVPEPFVCADGGGQYVQIAKPIAPAVASFEHDHGRSV